MKTIIAPLDAVAERRNGDFGPVITFVSEGSAICRHRQAVRER